MLREIVERQQTAVRLREAHDFARERAAVKSVFAFRRDRLKARGESRLAENLARTRRAALYKVAGRVRVRRELAGCFPPLMRGLFGDGKAVLCVVDGGREQFTELHGAEALRDQGPAVKRAGDGDRQHALVGDEADVLLLEIVE